MSASCKNLDAIHHRRVECRPTRLSTALALAIWLGLVSAGFAVLADYTSRPGRMEAPPAEWPVSAAVAPNRGGFTLLMFVHPHCPCSRASLHELFVLMRDAPPNVAVHLFFAQPDGFPDAWVEGHLWRWAGRMPGLTRHIDRGGREALLFQAHVSGCVVLYDAEPAPRFHGGITPGRGHQGDNRGRTAVLDFLWGRVPGSRRAPVYGCELHDEREARCCPS